MPRCIMVFLMTMADAYTQYRSVLCGGDGFHK
jgi:hypothetical protein